MLLSFGNFVNREEAVRLARFKDSYDVEVYINPDLVTFVRPYSPEATTINFSHNHDITVKMSVGAVVSALVSAGKP